MNLDNQKGKSSSDDITLVEFITSSVTRESMHGVLWNTPCVKFDVVTYNIGCLRYFGGFILFLLVNIM